MATGEGAKLRNMNKREDSGGSGVAQKLLQSIGALESLWPLGRGAKLCKYVEVKNLNSGMAQNL